MIVKLSLFAAKQIEFFYKKNNDTSSIEYAEINEVYSDILYSLNMITFKNKEVSLKIQDEPKFSFKMS